ncbi:hypothetical protein HX747_10385 [Streptomyces sp. L06]|nr:hypothetical protein [Streptomyces sp. L06]
MSGHGEEHGAEIAAKAELDALMGRFMDAFTNTGGRPSGRRDGTWFEGGGRKTTQFVRTPEGWRMSAMAWTDA